MPRLQGLLKRTSKAEELELELARQGTAARLERLLAQRGGRVRPDDEAIETADTDEALAIEGETDESPRSTARSTACRSSRSSP